MNDDYLPVGITYTGELFYVLYIQTDSSATAWKLEPAARNLRSVQNAIQPYVNQGYVPVGVTAFEGEYWTLLLKIPETTVEYWMIETYAVGTHADRNTNAAIEQDYIPWGLMYDAENEEIDILYPVFNLRLKRVCFKTVMDRWTPPSINSGQTWRGGIFFIMTSASNPVMSTNVVIIGAGPIGLEVAASLKRAGVDYLHFDAKQIGYTISWWPRNTNFFSTSERLAIAGIPLQNTHQQRITGEDYLAYLRAVVEQLDLQVKTYEPVVDIERLEEGFRIRTGPLNGEQELSVSGWSWQQAIWPNQSYSASPAKTCRMSATILTTPTPDFRKRLLVVGGRNSAVEAALRCWRSGSQVAISYRRAAFNPKSVKVTILP